jgi:hypothetical protein
MADRNSTHSVLRERIVEHIFVGDVLRLLWRRGVTDVEVLRSEFDSHGYDLVMARGRTVRHLQLKTGTSRKPSAVSVSLALGTKPSGCVLWIHVNDNLELGPFFWFGEGPGQPLPSIETLKTPRRPTHNKSGVRPERPNHRLVPPTRFTRVDALDQVLDKLFGNLLQ